MNLDDFTPYDSTAAEWYKKKRWWLGITLGDMLDKASDLFPEKEALVGYEKRYTYRELRSQADALAYSLLHSGFKPGDRVLLQLPNWPEFVIAYFALQKAGLVMVLLTVNHTAREVSHLADLTQPRGWIVPDHYRKLEFLPLIEQVQRQNPGLQQIILVSPSRPVKKDGKLWFDDMLTRQASSSEIERTVEGARPDPGNVCQILPSGGTTGLPKGAPRTHNDYICNVEYTSRAWDINVTDTCLVGTTVGHNLALLVCITGPIFHGAKVVLMDSTHPQHFCQLVQEEKITCTGLVPTLISRIVNYEGLERYDLSSLERIYVGAANSPPELVRSVESKIGARYINAFGMVEGPCSQSRPDDPIEIRHNTIGRPVCPYDLFITLDPDGNQTDPGVEGELAAKGPGVFTGYFKNPEANQKAFFLNGFFRTGDLAVIDGQGIIRITGRIKDIIIRGGENIAARDIEDLISSHPKVEYVAVVGMPDPEFGEQVCAFIKPIAGSMITSEEILHHLEELGASKVHFPARIELVQDIPLTAAGKADKKILKTDIEEKLRNEIKFHLKERKMKLKGKTTIVTGGAKGIGRAIALRLAREGSHIGILDIQKEAAQKTAGELTGLGVGALALDCDVTNHEKVKEAVAKIHQQFGSIDILINNAGMDVSKFFVDTDQTLWDKMINVNYRSFLNTTHACLPYMIQQNSGNIVSLGSDAGRIGNSGEVLYCGTKAAIMASSKALARELARFNIRVNCVSPGPVQTDLLAGLHSGEKGKKIMEAVAKMIPLKRLGEPEDVADVVAFFVSDDARYLTGQVLSVDGGLTMIG